MVSVKISISKCINLKIIYVATFFHLFTSMRVHKRRTRVHTRPSPAVRLAEEQSLSFVIDTNTDINTSHS